MVLDAFGVVMEIEDGGSPKEDQGPITRIRRMDSGQQKHMSIRMPHTGYRHKKKLKCTHCHQAKALPKMAAVPLHVTNSA